jgi:ribonuclease HI
MILSVYIDGGSKGNPGPASIGIVGYSENKKVFSQRADIGIATNNKAEYTAAITAFEIIKKFQKEAHIHIQKIHFFSDSTLLVHQLNGLFKVKNALIREYVLKIRIAEEDLGVPVTYTWISRVHNQEADDLVNNRASFHKKE